MMDDYNEHFEVWVDRVAVAARKKWGALKGARLVQRHANLLLRVFYKGHNVATAVARLGEFA